ncbi:CD209 antigen-like protein C [Pleurodeles waltl]|uniref:CD209 antigen-like protein C n=1 Tax=Pleurodeles waltl TaxID=8319 RepID=UPI0037097B75
MPSDDMYDNLRYNDRNVYSVVDESAARQQKAAKDAKESKRKICIWRVATTIASLIAILVLVLGVAFYFLKCKKQDSARLQELNMDMCVKTGIQNELKCSYCDRNWIFYAGNCYFLSMQLLNWIDSQNNCKNMSSHLVVVKNAKEEQFLESLVKQKTWIGLFKKDNGAWIWEDGTILEGNGFWLPTEPNNEYGAEGCVELAPFYTLNGWNDENCNSGRWSLCKRPADAFRMFSFN